MIRGFVSHHGREILLFTTASGTDLGPTHPPIQWVLGSLSLRVKQLGREADHAPLSSAEVRNEWSHIFTSPICLLLKVQTRLSFTSDNFIPIDQCCG